MPRYTENNLKYSKNGSKTEASKHLSESPKMWFPLFLSLTLFFRPTMTADFNFSFGNNCLVNIFHENLFLYVLILNISRLKIVNDARNDNIKLVLYLVIFLWRGTPANPMIMLLANINANHSLNMFYTPSTGVFWLGILRLLRSAIFSRFLYFSSGDS